METKHIDLSGDVHRRVIVDQVDGVYLGQPHTVLLRDGKTMLVAYPLGHGGPDTVLKRSDDGGLTWSDRLPVPDNFTGKHNAPSVHRVVDPSGVERLVLFVSSPAVVRSISEDNGETWTPLETLFGDEMRGTPGYKGHAPPKSVFPVCGGARYLAIYHDHFGVDQHVVEIVQTASTDGGRTWSRPRVTSQHPRYPAAQPCEPAIIRSPDGSRLLCLARENARLYHSLWMTSDDEGESWPEMQELPWELTGDRHIARYAPDGRMVVTFRDMARGSSTYGDFVAWVGSYEDIEAGRPGQYRVRLLKNHGRPGDTGYAGMEVLPDGTMVSTTYCVLEPGQQPLVVSVRFTMEDIDAAAVEHNVFEILMGAFGDIHSEKVVDHTFSFWWGATIYVRKSNLNVARIREPSLQNFPNGTEFRAYVEDQRIPNDHSPSHPDRLIGPEHIDRVVAILQGQR